MNIKESIISKVSDVLSARGVEGAVVQLTVPQEVAHGDYATSAALSYAKKCGVSPRELAEDIRAALANTEGIAKVELAGPGYVNITLAGKVLGDVTKEILHKGDMWGTNELQKGKRVMVEHTQPNPFKPFHIGHLMSNAIGESTARLMIASGADVVRANYQGDVGQHVAKAMWGIQDLGTDLHDVMAIGKAYAHGSSAYKNDPKAKSEIDTLNTLVYDKSDARINNMYDIGRKTSMDRFAELYTLLGSVFDRYYFESETASAGREAVLSHMDTVFEKSEGAVVFPGEKHGLNVRVFINSQGLPTYEAKDLGLISMKFKEYPLDLSIVTSAIEQENFFKIVYTAAGMIWPELKGKLRYVLHGMMLLETGKMSSRTGEVVTGESLLEKLVSVAEERAAESRADDHAKLARQIAVSAIKYQILKQAAGKNIVFNEDRALSLDGDSGPYVQYAHARACSILAAAHEAGITPQAGDPQTEDERFVTRILMQFPTAVARSQADFAPHHVAQYAGELAAAYNSWYAKERVVGTDAETASRRAALTHAVAITLKNALNLLGIEAPERM